jgi:hypothetical protein
MSQFIEIASEPNFDPPYLPHLRMLPRSVAATAGADVSGGGGRAQAHSENY